jgi:hypothetical protein
MDHLFEIPGRDFFGLPQPGDEGEIFLAQGQLT